VKPIFRKWFLADEKIDQVIKTIYCWPKFFGVENLEWHISAIPSCRLSASPTKSKSNLNQFNHIISAIDRNKIWQLSHTSHFVIINKHINISRETDTYTHARTYIHTHARARTHTRTHTHTQCAGAHTIRTRIHTRANKNIKETTLKMGIEHIDSCRIMSLYCHRIHHTI
jgi:hypothetical protein